MCKVILDTAEIDEDLKQELEKRSIGYKPLKNGYDVEYTGSRSALRDMIDQLWVDVEGHLKALITEDNIFT